MALEVSPVAQGTWGTVSITVPDWMESLRDTVNNAFELLNLVLELVSQALEFAKTFLTAFLDPISALIKAIIDEINAYIRDFRQIGFYIGGDYGLITQWPFDDLKGGYQAFERRMIARMSDRTDPTRPDVSARMDVLGFFTYLSVDASGVENLISYIQSLKKLFGVSSKDPSPFPTPIIQDVFYGPMLLEGATTDDDDEEEEVDLTTFAPVSASELVSPNMARVTWTVKPTGMKNPYNPIPPVGPKGFLVTVSTFEQPMALWYNRPAKDPGKERKEGEEGKLQQGREIGPVLDHAGTPVHLYGGDDMVAMEGSSLTYNDSFNSNGVIRDGKAFVFGRVDPNSNESIPLEHLRGGDIYYFQRTFLVDASSALAQWFTNEYSITLNLKDLPHRARITLNSDNTVSFEDLGVGGTYYVRVAACKKEVGDGTLPPTWSFNDVVAKGLVDKAPDPFRIVFDPGLAAVGPFSQAKRITFPEANTAEYLNALQTALLVLLLSRADLPHYEEEANRRSPELMAQVRSGQAIIQGTVARYTGMEASKKLIGLLFPDPSLLTRAGMNPLNFRALLRRRIQQLALDIYRKTGPIPEVEAAVVNATKTLRTVTWNQLLATVSYSVPETVTVSSDTGDGLLNEEGQAFLGLTPQVTSASAVTPIPVIQNSIDIGDGPLLSALLDTEALGTSAVFGIAPNIYSMGVDNPDLAEAMFFQEYALSGRTPDFLVSTNGPSDPVIPREVGEENIRALVAESHPFFARIYQANVKEDTETGDVVMQLPTDTHVHLLTLVTQTRKFGSYDLAPVFMLQPGEYKSSQDRIAAVFFRHLFTQYQGGVLYREANIALQAATAALTRSPQDGEWIAIRMFDAFPDLDNFLSFIERWVKGLNSALESVAEAITRYIEFVQAAIADLQALLRRINALIQSFLSFSVTLPSFSGLMLRSRGTDNLLADFLAAKNKPQDSPLSYGAGIVVVGVSPIPLWLLDLIFLIKEKQEGGDTTSFSQPPSPVGIEAVPPNPVVPPDPDPL